MEREIHSDELLFEIHKALRASLTPRTEEEDQFIYEVTHIVGEAAYRHVVELEEAIVHLKETIKRLSKPDAVDTGTTLS